MEDHQREPLKERSLGVAVFGLDPAYDTNQNTVVRNAAVNVRKRLVLYYLEPGHESEIQISLLAGSYIPQIDFPPPMIQEAETEQKISGASPRGDLAETAGGISLVPSPQTKPFSRSKMLLLLLILVMVLGICVSVLAWQRWEGKPQAMAHFDKLELFWQPVLSAWAPEPTILVCVEQFQPQGGDGQDVMPVGDALATADFVRFLEHENQKYHVSTASSVTAEDIQSSTVVLVGGAGNIWTYYATEGLRFHFSSRIDADSKESVWIEDSKNPSRKDWSLAAHLPETVAMDDFAIVARVKDPKNGLWRVVAGGLDGIATSVASRYLVDANYAEEMSTLLPKGRNSKNLEAVISFKVVQGKVSSPHMVAYEVW